jgi:dTDP-D-glucose 4,6-dehydratase
MTSSFEAKTDFDVGLKETIKWYIENQERID